MVILEIIVGVLGGIVAGQLAAAADLFLADVAVTALPVLSVCNGGGDRLGLAAK